jgi:hypothetical protein
MRAMKNENKTDKYYEELGKSLENILLLGYTKPSRMLFFTFLKGIVYGLGIFIGGTIIIALLVWALQQFNNVPLIGHLVQKIVNQVNH